MDRIRAFNFIAFLPEARVQHSFRPGLLHGVGRTSQYCNCRSACTPGSWEVTPATFWCWCPAMCSAYRERPPRFRPELPKRGTVRIPPLRNPDIIQYRADSSTEQDTPILVQVHSYLKGNYRITKSTFAALVIDRNFRKWYDWENQIEKAMTKTDLAQRFSESRGWWKPGRQQLNNPIPSELKSPKHCK